VQFIIPAWFGRPAVIHPQSCKEYDCLWQRGLIDDKPDACGFFLDFVQGSLRCYETAENAMLADISPPRITLTPRALAAVTKVLAERTPRFVFVFAYSFRWAGLIEPLGIERTCVWRRSLMR
jgi:hypothetical protein